MTIASEKVIKSDDEEIRDRGAIYKGMLLSLGVFHSFHKCSVKEYIISYLLCSHVYRPPVVVLQGTELS